MKVGNSAAQYMVQQRAISSRGLNLDIERNRIISNVHQKVLADTMDLQLKQQEQVNKMKEAAGRIVDTWA